MKNNELNADKVRNLCVFTTHTPVAAAFDKFSYDLLSKVLETEVSPEILMKYGGEDKLNMTLLALNLSKYTNGVTEAHMEYSRKLVPRISYTGNNQWSPFLLLDVPCISGSYLISIFPDGLMSLNFW